MKIIHLCFVLAVILVSACQNKTITPEDAHDHSHEEVSIQITEYNSEYELFAEADPMVKGETGGILAHFTKLSDFSALANASVTVSLIIGKIGVWIVKNFWGKNIGYILYTNLSIRVRL